MKILFEYLTLFEFIFFTDLVCERANELQIYVDWCDDMAKGTPSYDSPNGNLLFCGSHTLFPRQIYSV